MPVAPPVACLEQPCPNAAVDRGRCVEHRRTTSERGYGARHQAQRAEGLPTASCSGCGCRKNLELNHLVPKSLGGGDDPANKNWLCRCSEHGCHDRLGLRSDSRAVLA